MGFRDDQLAGHERARSLEHEVERLKAENAALRQERATASEPPRRTSGPRRLAGTLAGLALLAVVGAALVPVPQGRLLLVAAAALLLFFAVLLAVIGGALHVVQPGEVLVLSGLNRVGADGEARGYRIVRGGRVFRVPLLETATRLPLGPFPFPVEVRELYLRGSSVDLRGSAAVGVSRDAALMPHAVERFLGKSSAEIVEVARQTLEGGLRAAAPLLSGEQLGRDPVRLTEALLETGLEDDFAKLGLSLETFVVEDVTPR